MRLLIASSEFPPGPGGIGTHAFQIARHLRRLGHEIVVATAQDYADQTAVTAFNKEQAFPVVSLDSRRGAFQTVVSRARAIGELLESFSPELLLATGDRQAYLAGLLAARRGLNWVAIEHGRKPSSWELWLKRRTFSQATALVCVSQYTCREVMRMGIVPRAVHVIPNGADADVFRRESGADVEQTRRDFNLGNAPVVVTVGNVSRRKGQDVVIRAMPSILEAVPDALYLCVGLPNERPRFEALAHELGVARHVRFAGAVDQGTLVRLLNAADLFAMTSRHTPDQWEGYGIAVVEAALCGRPAVVSGDSGLAEAIVHGTTGLAVPEEDSSATASAITRLLEDHELRIAMGDAARRRALENQTWAVCAAGYDALVRRIGSAGSMNVTAGAYAGTSA